MHLKEFFRPSNLEAATWNIKNQRTGIWTVEPKILINYVILQLDNNLIFKS